MVNGYPCSLEQKNDCEFRVYKGWFHKVDFFDIFLRKVVDGQKLRNYSLECITLLF
jgi:hypothetical protein